MQSLNLVVTQHSSADAKIALFRSLFRGRDDVYPRRYESGKTGRSGYAPACANEWIIDELGFVPLTAPAASWPVQVS